MCGEKLKTKNVKMGLFILLKHDVGLFKLTRESNILVQKRGHHVNSSNYLLYNGRFAFNGLCNVVLPYLT